MFFFFLSLLVFRHIISRCVFIFVRLTFVFVLVVVLVESPVFFCVVCCNVFFFIRFFFNIIFSFYFYFLFIIIIIIYFIVFRALFTKGSYDKYRYRRMHHRIRMRREDIITTSNDRMVNISKMTDGQTHISYFARVTYNRHLYFTHLAKFYRKNIS